MKHCPLLASYFIFLASVLSTFAESVTADIAQSRATIRAHLSQCSIVTVAELRTNELVKLIDPELAMALRSLSSGDTQERYSARDWFISNGIESCVAMWISNSSHLLEDDSFQWMTTNAGPNSVGALLNAYDHAVANLEASYMSPQISLSLAATKSNCVAALLHVHAADFTRETGIDLMTFPYAVRALAVVEFARDKWSTEVATMKRSVLWDKERSKLYRLLDEARKSNRPQMSP